MVKPGKLINQSKPNLFFKLFYQVKYYDYESPVKVGNSSTGLSLNALFRVEPNKQDSSYTLNMTIQLTGLTDSALFSTSIQTSLDNTFTEYLYQRINYPLENLELPILDQIRNQTDDRVKWNFMVSFVRWLQNTNGIPISSPTYENCIQIEDRKNENKPENSCGKQWLKLQQLILYARALLKI